MKSKTPPGEMQQKKKLVKKKEVSDIIRLNKMALICYFSCCVIFSVAIGVCYRGLRVPEYKGESIICFALLWLPMFYSCYLYLRNRESRDIKNALFVLFGVFYVYVLYCDRQYLFFLFAIPMMILSITFYNHIFSAIVSVSVIILNILVALERLANPKEPTSVEKLFVVVIVTVVALFLNFSAYIMIKLQNGKMEQIEREKERFKALASVGIRRIFEYNIQDDVLMNAQSRDGNYGAESFIKDFREAAKRERYILFGDWEVFDEFMDKCKNGTPVMEAHMRMRDRQGDYKWYRVRGKMLYDEYKQPLKVVGTIEDIDEAKRMEIREADENMRDPLTKLYKKEYAKQLIQDFLANQTGSEYAGFLILDIDNFSILNEKMGNVFGDEILKNIANDIEKIFYSTDILGRVGGDEFVILMKNIKLVEDINKKIMEIQQVVNRTYIGETMNFGSTIGVGASVFPIDGVEYDVLYEKAEKALFHAKEAGKNCYGFYDASNEEIYKQYKLEEKHLKIQEADKKRDELGTSNSLIELAFKLIEETKDTDSAINLLLRQVARQMDLDVISICERVGDEFKLVYPYQCCTSAEFYGEEMRDLEYTQEQWYTMLEEFKNGNGMVCVSDSSMVENDTQRKLSLAYGIRSYVGCAFYDKGEYAGHIDFLDFGKQRKWTKDEIMTIRAVTNVVSAYLLKMKAYEDATNTVERLTGYDAITGLYKYEKFLSLVGDYIENAAHGNYAICYADFSNFKYINETYGYETGDKILRDFAENMMGYTEFFVYGSRVFSDNIVTLMKMNEYDEADLLYRLQNASNEFTKQIQNEYLDSNLVIAIGICPFRIDGSPVPIKNIISNANLARKEAKLPDRPRCFVYNESMGQKLNQEVAYANDMENAFKNREFMVYLQPKVNLKNNAIDGAEALVRWKKNDGTVIYPNDFIPVFEKNKTITMLDYYVYSEVCKYLANRIENGEDLLCISMNVSRVHLYSIKQMVAYVKNLLNKYKVPPEMLEFELTETVFTDKVEDTITLMNELRKLGVKVSMDDFGSGYSSLNVLTKLPLDVLKLDKEFLKDFEFESDEKTIIPSIIDMAKKMKLSVVCEGVETNEQVNFLRDVGCDYAQGFYYSRPVPIPKFDELLYDNGFSELS